MSLVLSTVRHCSRTEYRTKWLTLCRRHFEMPSVLEFIHISLTFVPRNLITNTPALGRQVIVRHRTGSNPGPKSFWWRIYESPGLQWDFNICTSLHLFYIQENCSLNLGILDFDCFLDRGHIIICIIFVKHYIWNNSVGTHTHIYIYIYIMFAFIPYDNVHDINMRPTNRFTLTSTYMYTRIRIDSQCKVSQVQHNLQGLQH